MNDAETLLGTESRGLYRVRLVRLIGDYQRATEHTPTPPQPMTNAPEPLTAADVEPSTNDAGIVVRDEVQGRVDPAAENTNTITTVSDTAAPIIGHYGRQRIGRYIGPFRHHPATDYPFQANGFTFAANGQYYHNYSQPEHWDIVEVMEVLPERIESGDTVPRYV